jgi:hypothetical protein
MITRGCRCEPRVYILCSDPIFCILLTPRWPEFSRRANTAGDFLLASNHFPHRSKGLPAFMCCVFQGPRPVWKRHRDLGRLTCASDCGIVFYFPSAQSAFSIERTDVAFEYCKHAQADRVNASESTFAAFDGAVGFDCVLIRPRQGEGDLISFSPPALMEWTKGRVEFSPGAGQMRFSHVRSLAGGFCQLCGNT